MSFVCIALARKKIALLQFHSQRRSSSMRVPCLTTTLDSLVILIQGGSCAETQASGSGEGQRRADGKEAREGKKQYCFHDQESDVSTVKSPLVCHCHFGQRLRLLLCKEDARLCPHFSAHPWPVAYRSPVNRLSYERKSNQDKKISKYPTALTAFQRSLRIR